MSLRRSRSVALVTALLLLAGGLFSCCGQHDRNEDVQREMEAIERKIVPLDTQVLARSGPVQGKWSITATWDIETKMDRVEYSKWLTSQLVPEFKIVKADESQLTLSKLTDGDTNSIECKFALANARLHIHAVFSVSPDELWCHPWLDDPVLRQNSSLLRDQQFVPRFVTLLPKQDQVSRSFGEPQLCAVWRMRQLIVACQHILARRLNGPQIREVRKLGMVESLLAMD